MVLGKMKNIFLVSSFVLLSFVFFKSDILATDPPVQVTSEKIYCDASGKPTSTVTDTQNPRIFTALGCIPVKAEGFVAWLLPVLFGIMGGISFLLMVYGFIKITTSEGDPKAVEGAKETITSAISGLLLSIFALFILRLIVVGILRIPGIN